MKTALVLGANGFIGGHLVARLKAEGYWVRAVGSPHAKFPNRMEIADEVVTCDLRDSMSLSHIFWPGSNAFDEVYHLAANTGGATYINSGDHDADVMTSCILIDTNVARLCTSHRVKKVFFASSACVYNGKTDHSACVESEVYPASPDNEYGWAKLFSERLFQAHHRNHGLNVKIARFHSVVGPHSPWIGGKEKAHSALARKVAQVENGGSIDVIGDGTQTRTFLYVDDAIDAVRLLMTSDNIADPVNIGSDHLVSIAEYLDVLREVSGKRFTVIFFAGPTGVKGRACSLAKVTAQIGWRPKTSLVAATEKTYLWIERMLSK